MSIFFNYDIVVSRNLYFSFLFSFFCSHVYEFHSIPTGWRRAILGSLLKNKKMKFICITEHLKKDSMDLFRFSGNNVIVLHDAASPAPENNYIDQTPLIMEQRNLNVGYFGHLHQGRGVEIIEKLASRLPVINFHVIGGQYEQVEQRKFKNKKLKNLKFYGHLPYGDARLMMVKCDLLLLPYQTRTFLTDGKTDTGRWMSPLKLFEYMSSNVAIISSDLPVLREVLSHNKNCLLVEPSNLEEWENAILSLTTDKLKALRLAQNARAEYEKFYNWNIRARKILTECI